MHGRRDSSVSKYTEFGGKMGEAEERILQMLENGSITAEEAEKLLAALNAESNVVESEAQQVITPDLAEETTYNPQPALSRFRHYWRIPFIVALGSLILSFVGLTLMYQSSSQVALLGFICVWSIFIVALITTTFFLFVRNAPWLHLRVKEKEGRRIAISLPLPMRLGQWGINIAKRFVPTGQRANLEMASNFMRELSENPNQEPFVVDIDDEDGDQVQIFIG